MASWTKAMKLPASFSQRAARAEPLRLIDPAFDDVTSTGEAAIALRPR